MWGRVEYEETLGGIFAGAGRGRRAVMAGGAVGGAAAPRQPGEDAVPGAGVMLRWRAGTAMEAALSAAEPLDAAVQQLRDSVDETVEKALHSGRRRTST